MGLDSSTSDCQICNQKKSDKMYKIKNNYEEMNEKHVLDIAQDDSCGNKVTGENFYLEEPLNILRLPTITTPPISNHCSSEDVDESLDYQLDNGNTPVETDMKRRESSRNEKDTIEAFDGMTEQVVDKINAHELFKKTLDELSMSSSDESVTDEKSDNKTTDKPYCTGQNQSIEHTLKRKVGCDKDNRLSSPDSVYTPSPSTMIKKQKRTHRTTSAITISQQTLPVVDAGIDKTADSPTVESSKIVKQNEEPSNAEILYCYCRKPYDEVSSMIACDRQNCAVEWYHFDCVGVTFTPEGNWYCPDCR